MRKILVVAAISMITSSAFAINTSVFLDAPITRLSVEELEAFLAFIDKTLDQSPAGKTVEWKAPKTRFVSKLTPGKAVTDAGRHCREIIIESNSHDRFQRGRYLFCKLANGEWKVSEPHASPRKERQ